MNAPSVQQIRLVEALVFASPEPVSEQAVAALLRSRATDAASADALAAGLAGSARSASGGEAAGASDSGAASAVAGEAVDDTGGEAPGEPDARAVLLAVQARFAEGGVVLVEVANGWQFRTAPDLAPSLTTVLERPRRLPRVAMETLAIVAYHQPCTRTDIEAIRGVSLGEATLDQLLETGLIVPRGRKEVPGRPVLWGTSPLFLQRFGLVSLRDLPRREELLVELPAAGASAGVEAGEASAADAAGHDG